MRFSDIVLDDSKLSMAAKGVFATLGLVGSGCAVVELAKRSADDRDSVIDALRELADAGYVYLDAADRVHVQVAGSFGLPQ